MGGPDYNKVSPPKGFGDIPRFVREMFGEFFSRLFYTFSMVWKTGRWILVLMVFISVFGGVMPIVGSLISKEILNGLQLIIAQRSAASATGASFEVTFWGSMVMLLIIFFFLYRILNQIVNRIGAAVKRIAGEKVTKYVKVQIMQKAKEVDIASFDMPEFYEKLENANREAGSRPISVISSTFDVISTLISLASYIIVLATAPGMWWAALVMLAVSFPSAVVSFYYRKKNFMYMRRRSKDRRQMKIGSLNFDL